MKCAIYARYSSENQRPESLEDQIAACRRLARERGFTVLDDHIYTDKAKSGARKDRQGLVSLLAAALQGAFEVVLVDDLSRLARDNYLMLSILAELHFEGVRVLSVADGLDSDDQEAILGIQIRGIFNELQLRDLKKKTLRGQIGQKERGYSVGERTFGYRSVPVGEMKMDKKGRPRPDGYRMEIEPREAATVLRIFKSYAEGQSLTKIVKRFNHEGVPGRIRSSKGWSSATVSRILDNEKYVGRWVWNRSESRRDPQTGRRRRFQKPESDWIIQKEERLRIVPQTLWEAVRARRRAVRSAWPGGQRRGFSSAQKGRQAIFPTHLLSGGMTCGVCGGAIVQVSGKSGGYYGCLAASKHACDNKILVRRSLTERVIMDAVRRRVTDAAGVAKVLEYVRQAIAELRRDLPEQIRLREGELAADKRRLANFLDFIGEGRGSRALGQALLETERRVEALKAEVEGLRASEEEVFTPPPIEWIQERLQALREVLERNTPRSATLLRQFLGPIRLEPVRPDIGRPYFVAVTAIDALALIETPPDPEGPKGGSKSLRSWRWRESNPRA